MTGKITRLAVAGLITCVGAAAAAQDFAGGYGGVTARNNFAAGGATDVAIGAFAGYNADVGNGVVLGVEGEVDYDWNSVWGGSDLTATANLRAGVDAGAALVYGKVGAGYSTTGSGVWGAGAGVDVPVLDEMFLRAEVERLDPLAGGLATRYNTKLGLGYRF
ncbi:outer membrane protein [Sinisalibacter lacisalsi]|uniref:Outer membrane protein n=1 Tax=Sinisalibacter lacisalsi TaxID=1526570 RepID=A0ABQ1QM83_9RHOB|nr:outer membrane beta-barrel protein [Sinisalibacter lacisalsi]GGD33201.1 outer membrane protein [Sinisalibacter lacisalsi]